MRPTKEQRLAAAALIILNEEGPPLRMASYTTSEHHPCGTTCCVAGHAALLDPRGGPSPRTLTAARADSIELKASGFSDYFIKHYGYRVVRFLFYPDWPDSRKQAAARILYFLTHKAENPLAFDGTGNFAYIRPRHRSPTPDDMEDQLRKFLHPNHPQFKPQP